MKIAVAQLGARMHYAVPRILHRAGHLHAMFTDICAVKGWPQLLRMCPENFLPKNLRRLRARVPTGVPGSRIRAFTSLGLGYRRRLSAARNLEQEALAHLWAGDELNCRILAAGLEGAEAVYTFNSAGLRLLQYARDRGLRSFYEQTIAPVAIERRLMAAESERWPGWEEITNRELFYDKFQVVEQQEWKLAEIILCGSEFVRDGVAQLGGPVERCRVVPYGVDVSGVHRHQGDAPLPGSAARKLRVLTVGTVGLRKGAPYVADIARQLADRAEFRWAGPVALLEPGIRALEQAGVQLLHAVPRSEIHAQFSWADVFLLPSVCEGSATVTYEALLHGLPVITTPNTGSLVQDGVNGRIVPVGDCSQAVTALREFAQAPDLLRSFSAAALATAEDLTVAAYAKRLLGALQLTTASTPEL